MVSVYDERDNLFQEMTAPYGNLLYQVLFVKARFHQNVWRLLKALKGQSFNKRRAEFYVSDLTVIILATLNVKTFKEISLL